MHVNFGILPPFEERIRNKQQRYEAYAQRGNAAMEAYVKSFMAQLGEQETK